MVKNFGGKKVWRKGCFARIGKILWRMLTCIANRQSKINSKTKPNYSFAHVAKPLFGACS